MAITVSMGLLDHFKRLFEYFPSIWPHLQLASIIVHILGNPSKKKSGKFHIWGGVQIP